MSFENLSLSWDVQKAQRALGDWLNGFLKQTEVQVEMQLGPNAERSTWTFAENQELLLRYKTSEQGTLELYFYADEVVNSSYQLLSS